METKIKKSGAPKLFFIITAVLSAAAALIQTYLFYAYYDEGLNLYKTGATLTGFFYIGVFICTLFCASSYFILKKTEMKILPPPDRFVTFTAILSGFQLAASVLFNVFYFVSGKYTGMTAFRAAVFIVSVPAAAYFIITALSNKPKKNVLVLCCFSAIIWATIYLMSIYFDMSSPLNSPIRILNQLSLITIMLYFTFEARYLIGKPKPRLYFPVALSAMLFIPMASVSDMFLTFAGFRPSTQETVFRIAEVAIMLYITARLRSIAFKKEAVPSEKQDDLL
jgi:hypothetical protein